MKKKLMVTFILVAMAVSMIPIAAYAAKWDLVSPVVDSTKEQDPTTWSSIAVGPGDYVTLKVNFTNPITIPAGSTFVIDTGVTASGNIDNKGTLIVNGAATGTVDNSGTADIYGTVSTLDNTGKSTIYTGATVTQLNNNAGTTITSGTINGATNAGNITMLAGTLSGTVTNNGNLDIQGGTATGATIANNSYLYHPAPDLWTNVTNVLGSYENGYSMCSVCSQMINPSTNSGHLSGCANETCTQCGGKMSAHLLGCPLKSYKFYYKKKDTTTFIGTDDPNVAMTQGNGTVVKLGQDIPASDGPLATSNYAIELDLDGHTLDTLSVLSGSVTLNNSTGRINKIIGKNVTIKNGDIGSAAGVGNCNITGGIFDVKPDPGSYDSTKYAVISSGSRYKVVSVDSPEYKGTTTLACSLGSVQVVDASNTTGISTTDASRSTIWQDVKNVLEAYVADGKTLTAGGAVGELITGSAWSMSEASIKNTLTTGSSPISIVLRKEDLTMAAAGFDYQHIKAKLTTGYSVAALYDISIICYFGNTPFMKLTRTSNDIDITLGIHSSLRAAGRRYEVVGVHNDNYGSYYFDQDYFLAQNMNAGTTSYHTVNFKTNFFSTYALAALGGNFNVPVTADSNNTTLWVTLLCVSGMCGACAIYLRRRKAKVY